MHSLFLRTRLLRQLLTLVISVLVLGCALGQAEDPKAKQPLSDEWNPESPYYKVMAENIIKLDTIIARPELERVTATLERIARVEKDKALPQYYLAIAYATIAFREKDIDKIDVYCDRSIDALATTEALGGIAPEELLVIRALVQYARLQVDYMGRGLEASQLAEKYLRKGYELNPKNPRVLGMISQHYLKIPAQIGGSRQKACKYATVAIEAYAAEKANFPANIYPIVPHWGEIDLLEVAAKYCYYQPTPAKTKAP